MVLDDLGGGGEERLVGAPAHQRVAVVRGRRGVPHEGGRHVPAARNARVEGLRGRMDKLSETRNETSDRKSDCRLQSVALCRRVAAVCLII